MSHDLSNRVALVTGASRGLGAAMALRLGACGARVAVNYAASREKADGVCQAIASSGGHAAPFAADVRDEAEVQRLVRDVEFKLGPIDILVINATGPQPFLAVEEMTWRACLDQLEFFVKSPLLLVQAVVGGMKERRYGRIINVGSEVFEKGVPRFANYVSAKGAQLGLTRSWAMELAGWGITVNLVAPGWIPTERHSDDPPQSKDAYAAAVPLGHMGEAGDVAACVAFLASDDAKFITGQKISVNGGNSLEQPHTMIEFKYTGDALQARIDRAVENVKGRLQRVTEALNAAQVPYAVVGGLAVQHWVAQVDESVVRNTRDVEIILNRGDLPKAASALEGAGFVYRHAADVTMFLDGPDAKARDAVHVVFAGEKVRDEYLLPAPEINEYDLMQSARTLPLESLVRMKLTSFRRKDQVHIQDMISVGLIDASWQDRFSPELQVRLNELLEDPEG